MSLILKMFTKDTSFMIHVFDLATEEQYQTLMIKEEIPTETTRFNQYFMPAWDKQNKGGTTIVFHCETQYSHVKWKHILNDELKTTKTQICLHPLDSIEMKAVGFFLRKSPSKTHMNHFAEYICGLVHQALPKIELFQAYPKAQAGFGDAVKTEVMAVCTSKEQASMVNLALSQIFPISSEGEVYISFIQDLDEHTLKQIYLQQNQWLKEAQTITIGDYGNIDQKYSIGEHQELSLQEFMKLQPFQAQKVPIDIKNGGKGGRT